jgi:glutamate racemase
MNRLGIIDWGIGGVSIYKLIKERLGNVPVTYFSDTGVTPYGKMTRRQLVSRLNDVISYLKTQGVTHIVFGCNAASTAIPHLADHDIPIGGRRTVLSGVYRQAFARHGIEFRQRIAQPLSGLVESGDVSSAKLRRECKRILKPLKNRSHILLACTHYPAIEEVLKEFVSPETLFIDPADQLVRKIIGWQLHGAGADEILTSGDVDQMKNAAKTAFGVAFNRPSNARI